jgi:hypothetical protein
VSADAVGPDVPQFPEHSLAFNRVIKTWGVTDKAKVLDMESQTPDAP